MVVDWAAFEAGLKLAEAELPQPAEAAGRPGLGFLIAHQGRTGDYVVLGWWDHENELPLRVFLRRQAYVATMLTPAGTGREGYLGQVHDGEAEEGLIG